LPSRSKSCHSATRTSCSTGSPDDEVASSNASTLDLRSSIPRPFAAIANTSF
jgi:hypothetical protein